MDKQQFVELLDKWYVEWKDKITDNDIPHRLGFAKEDLKGRVDKQWNY